MASDKKPPKGGSSTAPPRQAETPDGELLSCSTCRFWADTGHEAAQCRKHAPPPALVTGAVSGGQTIVWPVTHNQMWCGEHEPKTLREDSDAGNGK